MERPTATRPAISKRVSLVATLLLFACLATGTFLIWKANQSRSLLPSSIASQITGFTPYFFYNEIPGGYTLDEKNISFDQGIVIMPLTRPDGPTVVMTEQIMPSNLSRDLLSQDDSEEVRDMAKDTKAFINKIEGRTVGIMTSDKHNILLLINAPGDLKTEDISELLKNLRPAR